MNRTSPSQKSIEKVLAGINGIGVFSLCAVFVIAGMWAWMTPAISGEISPPRKRADLLLQGVQQDGPGQVANNQQDDDQQDDDQDDDVSAAARRQSKSAGQGERDENGHRIFEREPYDELQTRSKDRVNEVDVSRIVPFRYPDNKTPQMMRPSEVIIVRLVGNEKEYEVKWSDVLEIIPFNQLILREANFLVDASRFNEAFDYFDYLRQVNAGLVARDRPEIAGLSTSIERYLFQEARRLRAAGDEETSLALLAELFDKNATYPGLAEELAAIIDGRVERAIAAESFLLANRLLRNLSDRFPDNATVAKWSQQLQSEARARAQDARQLLDSGELHAARESALAAATIWPLPEATSVLEEAQQKSPRVVVAVTRPAPESPDPVALDDWASRRVGRLMFRLPAEFRAPGPLGGEYVHPLGDFEFQSATNRLTFQIRPGMRWSEASQEITGYDLVGLLENMTDRESAEYIAGWSELLDRVELNDVYGVDVQLRRTHPAPGALLTRRLRPWNEAPGVTAANGPFEEFERGAQDTRYRAHSDYFAQGVRQPKELVERQYSNWQNAAAALIEREAAVLDRVMPWDVRRLSEVPYLRVEEYVLPTIHCLVPNMQRALPANRHFRRGLLHGLDRQVILESLLQGNPPGGSRVISGPFPAERYEFDSLAYAYEKSVAPLPHDPQMGMILCTAAHKLLTRPETTTGAAAQNNQDNPSGNLQDEIFPIPTIIVAHPPNGIARAACSKIKEQWARIGLSVRLIEQDPGDSSTDYDFRYVELQIAEPLVDAQRLFGTGGLIPARNAYVRLALENLQRATNLPAASQQLRRIHELTQQDVTVLPLWQLTEHYAYHTSVRNLAGAAGGASLVTLYQNIEAWQSPPALLPGESASALPQPTPAR